MFDQIITVIGSGTMGNGIAHVFAISSEVQKVFLVDLDDKILERAQSIIRKNLNRQVKKDIISDADSKQFYNKIVFKTYYPSITFIRVTVFFLGFSLYYFSLSKI